MIADGDWVVVRRQPDADSGDIVAAMFASESSADSEATVKTLKKAGFVSQIQVPLISSCRTFHASTSSSTCRTA